MTFRKRLLAACLALGTLGAAQAHNLWLLPSSTVLSKAEWITVDAAVSNDLFFFNHVPLGLDALAVTSPSGQPVAPENALRGKLRSVFDLNLSEVGTYRVAVASEGVLAAYQDKATGQNRRWRGPVSQLAASVPVDAVGLKLTQSGQRIETFVTVGKPSALRPVGRGLELVPVTHPNDLVRGEAATLALRLDGQPAAGVTVTVVAGGSRYRDRQGEIQLTTDAQGQFSVTWPSAGMYWLEAEVKDRKTTVPGAQERRLVYSATLEVLP